MPVTARHACDSPSCHFVTKFRELISVENVWRSVVPTTVRPAIPLWSSVSRFPYPTFRILSILEWDTLDGPSCLWRSVVGSVVSASFSRNKICCSKRLNRSLHKGKEIYQRHWWWSDKYFFIFSRKFRIRISLSVSRLCFDVKFLDTNTNLSEI